MTSNENALNTDQTIWHHIQRTAHLALPVVLSRIGIIAMVAMDVVVLGRAGSSQLADYVLGQAVVDTLIVMMIGLLLGVPVLTARTLGIGEARNAGSIWYRGLLSAVVFGVIMFLILQFSENLFLAIGQEAAQAARSAEVSVLLGASLPFIGLFTVSSTFLEAAGRPLIGTITILMANTSNIFLNILFVFGWGPIPAMGAIGCALATVLNFALLSLTLIFFIRFKFAQRRHFGILDGLPNLWRGGEEQRKIGLGAGASFGLESAAFSVLVLMVGFLGEQALASYGVLFQFIALFFMGALGIATATQIRVGNAWGREDHHGMKYAGWVGLALSVVFTGASSVLLYSVPNFMVRIFTTDAAIIATAVPVVIWIAACLVFDGGQVVVNHACRGRGDIWVPTACHFMSYWLLMLPASAYCTFILGYGISGIFMGVAISAVFSVSVLSARFAWLCRI